MPRQLNKKQQKQRNALIVKWLREGIAGTEIQKRVKRKYSVGVHYNTIRDIKAELGKPQVLSSPSGLVPAREVSPQLQNLITKVADAMVDDGVLTITIDGREVSITHTPEETTIEV